MRISVRAKGDGVEKKKKKGNKAEPVDDSVRKPPPKKTGRRGIGPAPDKDDKPAKGLQKALPGMEDRTIPELDEAAHKYAEVRDERIALNRREKDLKELVHTLMNRHDKKHYKVGKVQIDVVSTDETVKVKILKEETEE